MFTNLLLNYADFESLVTERIEFKSQNVTPLMKGMLRLMNPRLIP